LPACRITAVTFLVPFVAWVAVRSPRRAALVGAVAGLAFLPWAAYYAGVYGSPFGPSSGQLDGGLWRGRVFWPIAGVLASPGRGLLVYQPWVVLALLACLPGVRRAAESLGRRSGPTGWWGVAVAALVFQVGVVSAWWNWWGGSCWGSRLVVESVPLCALLGARPIAVLVRTGRGRALVLTLAGAGFLAQAPGVYLGGFRWNTPRTYTLEEDVWSWSRAPFLTPITGPSRP
jgi:hypothetical protein